MVLTGKNALILVKGKISATGQWTREQSEKELSASQACDVQTKQKERKTLPTPLTVINSNNSSTQSDI